MNKNNDSHVMSYKKLLAVLSALFILTGVTISVSSIDLGPYNVWMALFIASIKGSFVLLFFMHLKYEGKLIVYSFISTLFFLTIMISFTFWDVAFR